jgi:phosphoenolpyruvate-protein kinase (PTS system EI component)
MRMSHIAIAALLCAVPAVTSAHHGWSAYSADKALTITAPITEIRWANPHGAAAVQYQGKRWEVVLSPIARMETRGLTAEMLKAAKSVTLIGQPRTDGTPEMKIQRIIVNGKEYNLLA